MKKSYEPFNIFLKNNLKYYKYIFYYKINKTSTKDDETFSVIILKKKSNLDKLTIFFEYII